MASTRPQFQFTLLSLFGLVTLSAIVIWLATFELAHVLASPLMLGFGVRYLGCFFDRFEQKT